MPESKQSMSKISTVKILCLDDEPNILEAFQRQLRGRFNLDMAVSGNQALQMIAEHGPYDIIISDLRMPGMDGIEFLQKVKNILPNSVRLMLTGNADQESAVRAVNEGNIFRFLNKPCSPKDLLKALEDAAMQYRLITAEKDLLQNTLSGSIKLLTDILSFIDPTLFGQSIKLRQLIQKIIPQLELNNSWEIELAGMLSNIGLVTVPSDVKEKYRKKIQLSTEEQNLIEKVPAIGQSLLANIPRLEGVAEIVLHQNNRFDGASSPSSIVKRNEIPFGSRIIKIVKDFLELEAEGISAEHALEKMKYRQGWYDLSILSSFSKLFLKEENSSFKRIKTKIYEIKSSELFIGQTLLSDIRTKEGILVVSAGSIINETLLELLNNYSKFVGIKEPIKVDTLTPLEK